MVSTAHMTLLGTRCYWAVWTWFSKHQVCIFFMFCELHSTEVASLSHPGSCSHTNIYKLTIIYNFLKASNKGLWVYMYLGHCPPGSKATSLSLAWLFMACQLRVNYLSIKCLKITCNLDSAHHRMGLKYCNFMHTQALC